MNFPFFYLREKFDTLFISIANKLLLSFILLTTETTLVNYLLSKKKKKKTNLRFLVVVYTGLVAVVWGPRLGKSTNPNPDFLAFLPGLFGHTCTLAENFSHFYLH